MPRMTRGRVFPRGKSMRYYVQFYADGKQHVAALRDRDGLPITNARAAREAADLMLLPFRLRGEEARAEALAERHATLERKARLAEQEMHESKCTLENGLDVFTSCPFRSRAFEVPGKTERKMLYARVFRAFREWMEVNHSDKRTLSKVTPDMAMQFRDALGGTPQHRNIYIAVMRKIYASLIKSGHLSCLNPFGDLQRLPEVTENRKPLTHEMAMRLIAAADGETRLLLAIGYYTGLRLGDCCTLLWREVFMDRGVIVRQPRKTLHTARNQNEARVKVGIPFELGKMLTEARAKSTSEYVLPVLAEKYLRSKPAVTTLVAEVFKKCGIRRARQGTGKGTGKRAVVEYCFHSLRYSYASMSAELGVPAAIIQQNLGHGSPAMTEHYTKISDQAAAHYASLLSSPLEDSRQTTRLLKLAARYGEAVMDAISALSKTASPFSVNEAARILESAQSSAP